MKYFDLSNSQLMIWTGQLLNPDSPQYNMAFAIEISGSVDEMRFKKAFRKLEEEVDVLQSTFAIVDGIPKMVFNENVNTDLEVMEMTSAAWEIWKEKNTQQAFDITEKVFTSVLVKVIDGPFFWYINQHHLITDGWAFTLLVNKMMALYLNLDSDKLPAFKEKLTNRKPHEKSISYWNSCLDKHKVKPVFNRKSNDFLEPRAERLSILINSTETQQLKDIVSESDLRLWSTDLGLFTLFLTILAATTHRLTHKKEISIGTPALNRFSKSDKNTVGLFIEMFPVKADISTGETYASLYMKYSMDANNFLRYAAPDASTAELNKTFNIVLNYINASFSDYENLSLKSSWIHPGASDPGHHVSLQVTDFDSTGEMTLSLDMNDQVFNDNEKVIFMETFMLELAKFKSDRQQPINQNEKEELAIIETVNKTEAEYPKDLTLVNLFADQVSLNAERIAVKFEEEIITYRELNEKSNQLAHYILKRGIQKGDAVGIMLERSLELIISIIGIIKAGGAYVPIDIEYPEARKDFIIEDAEIDILISAETSWDEVFQSPKSAVDIQIFPSDLIYTIYTSGSTGVPKGVMNQHDGIFNRLFWQTQEFDLGPDDVLLQKTNYTFDVSVPEFFLPLITGCKLVIARPGGHRDSDYLKAVVDSEKITCIHFVPPMLDIFLLSLKNGDCSSLRYVSCSGESLSPGLVNRFRAIFPHVELYNLFGPTEAAIEVSTWKAPKGRTVDMVPIGKPIANVKLKIVDEKLNACSIGIPGELLIGGIQVARGYKNRPELNTSRFLESEGIRWYRTGDLCQWMSDGNLEFFGRMDNQVKVRGFRVELGEVEEVIKTVDGVQEAVVLVKDQGILAFVVSDEGIEIKEELKKKLPDYMLPSQIIVVEEIPFLSNGKINRRALLDSVNVRKSISKPSNEFQEFVHEIWCKVLKVNEVDVEENFFNIGGDSLSGIRVITTVNKELELEFPVVLIFHKSTISELAAHIEAEIDKRLEES